jgi:hypothetical protein
MFLLLFGFFNLFLVNNRSGTEGVVLYLEQLYSYIRVYTVFLFSILYVFYISLVIFLVLLPCMAFFKPNIL